MKKSFVFIFPIIAFLIFLAGGCASSRKEFTEAEKRSLRNRTMFRSLKYRGTVRMKDALDNGANPNARNNGTPVLMAAVQEGRGDLAELLLKYKADPMKRDGDGDTVLHAAAARPDQKLLKLLLKRVPVNTRGYKGRTPLMIACLAGNLDNVTILLDAGADMRMKDSRGANVIYYAACSRTEPLTPQPVITDPKEKPVEENEAVRIMTLFEKKGLEKRYFTDATSSCSPLLVAIRQKNNPAAVYLLSWQENFGWKSGRESLGKNLASVAIQYDNLPVMRALVAKNLCLNQDRTIVLKVLNALSMDGIYKLLARYWLIPRRYTPLHEACVYGRAQIAGFLVLAGSDPYVVSNEEKNAYDYAVDSRTYDAVKDAEKSRF